MFVQIQLLEGLLESWSEYENNVQCLKTWFETQEKRMKQQHRIGDQASVQNAMKDCQVTCLSGGQAPFTVWWHMANLQVMTIESYILKNAAFGNKFLWLHEL